MPIELVFIVDTDPEGGFRARALGASIFTQADDREALRMAVDDALRCHFPDEASRPRAVFA